MKTTVIKIPTGELFEFIDKFSSEQCREIILGLKNNLDVEKYSNPIFSAEQMQEIRLGLQDGIDVDRYAYPSISPESMHRVRKQLVQEAKQPKEEPFELFKKGFIAMGQDPECATILAQGMMQGVAVGKYLHKSFSADQLNYFVAAEKCGVDVTPYFDGGFNDQQVDILLQAERKGIDVASFRDPIISADDMHFIVAEIEQAQKILDKRNRAIVQRLDKYEV